MTRWTATAEFAFIQSSPRLRDTLAGLLAFIKIITNLLNSGMNELITE